MQNSSRADPASAVRPEVSVIIPVFNGAATLRRAAESALRQSVKAIELIIADDGSTDETSAVASRIAADDPRVRILGFAANRGKPAVMNVAAAAARGEWIAILDADDWYEPDRLDSMLREARRRDADLVADNQFFHDAGAAAVVRLAFPPKSGARPVGRADLAAGSNPFAAFDYGLLKPVVRTRFLAASGIAWREDAPLSEDFLFLLDCVAGGARIWLMARPLYHWTEPFGTVSRHWTATGAGPWRYDFGGAAAATAAHAGRLRRRGEPELAALLERRARAFLRLEVLARSGRMRAGGRVFAGLALLLLHPPAWPLAVRRAWRRLATLRPRPFRTGA